MRNYAWLLLATIFGTTFTACNHKTVSEFKEATNGPIAHYRVMPGAVEGSNDSIIGSATLVIDPSGDVSPTGGACLIYLPANEMGPNCEDDTPCRVEEQTKIKQGYCAPIENNPHSDVATGEKKCWYQPATPSCYKSPNAPLGLGTKHPTDPFISPHVLTARPILWRTVSCQNIKDRGCMSTDPTAKKYRFGNIRRFD